MKKHYLLFLIILSIAFSNCNLEKNKNSYAPKEGDNSTKSEIGLYDAYEDFGRAIWQKPNLVIEEFGDLSGKTVADIGAGTGFFTRRLANKVKKVIAIDIDRRFVHFLDSIRVKEFPPEYQDRLETRLSKIDDPMLKPGEVDAALIVNTFMYMDNRVEYLTKLKKGLKKDGTLVIVDFKKGWTPIGPPAEIRLDIKDVTRFLQEASYQVVLEDSESLDYQYIVVAKAK